MLGIGFTVFLKCGWKDNFFRINHSDIKCLSGLWCAYIRILHKNSVFPFRQRKLSIFEQQFAWSKISLYIQLQVLTNCDTHWENVRTYRKCIYGVSWTFSVLLQRPTGILDSFLCVIHFSNNLEYLEYSDWILRIFTFIDKNPLYVLLIFRIQLLWGSKWL